MGDRSTLFRTSNGAFQDVSTSDNLLAAGLKRASGNITVLTLVGDIILSSSDDISILGTDNATLSSSDILLSSILDTVIDAGGKIIFSSPDASAYDAANQRWGFGNPSPSVQWDFFSAAPSATQGHMQVRNSTGTMFEVDLQNGLVTVGSSLVPAQLRTWATTILAALRVGSVAGDPSTLANGDIWYDATSGKFRARESGSSVDIIGGGSSVSPEDVWRLGLLHGVS